VPALWDDPVVTWDDPDYSWDGDFLGGGGGASVTPTTVTATSSVPVPTVTATKNAAVTPTTVLARVVEIPTPGGLPTGNPIDITFITCTYKPQMPTVTARYVVVITEIGSRIHVISRTGTYTRTIARQGTP
jgi:hypothetical protein